MSVLVADELGPEPRPGWRSSLTGHSRGSGSGCAGGQAATVREAVWRRVVAAWRVLPETPDRYSQRRNASPDFGGTHQAGELHNGLTFNVVSF
jgi:hypothetical protein